MKDKTKPADSASPAVEERSALPRREATVRVIPRTVAPTRAEGAEGAATAEERAAAAGGETIEIAISSEAPVERYDWTTGERYLEVLGHGPGEVDLSYCADGMPLLVGHDSREYVRDQIGLVENVTLGDDRMLRGITRFSKAQNAQDKKQDMLDGIRKKISVGYDPGETYTQTKDEKTGVITRRYTGWCPMEASSVPIPADYSVGVGRNGAPGAERRPDIRLGAQRGKDTTVKTDEAAPATASVISDADRAEIIARAKQHNMSDKLPDWIGNNRTIAQVGDEILAEYKKRSDALLARGGDKGVIELTDKEARQYSIMRAINNAANSVRDGLEGEISDEIAKRTGKSYTGPQSFFAPTNIQRQIRGLGRPGGPRGSRVSPLAAGTSASGQQLVFTEYAGFIPLLRAKMRTLELGARLLTGLNGNPGFVTQPSATTFQWIGETTSPSATSFGTGLRTMTPHNGASLTKFSRQLLAQSSEDVESLVWDDLALGVALGLDLAGLAGTGSNNQPTGIVNTTGIGAVTLGTAGGAITFPKLVDLETAITTANADLNTMAYLTTAKVAGQAKQIQLASGTNGQMIWTGTVHDGLVNGYGASISGQVPSTGTKGSVTGSLHSVIFGVWSELLYGEWGAMEMIVDPYASKPTLIEVAVHIMADVFLRHVEAFSAMPDVVVP